ncbi:hypothetical protein HDU87_001211 [Geranomyces variabilis]|uniref:Uncharacterized protein n=1 Tax=Geranomyces variabilis TaxID=109894 RepID=A0AAD5XI90_9FUNG|nr:hypothetical protein HDU87_001211 [Geranomyces variabilis]
MPNEKFNHRFCAPQGSILMRGTATEPILPLELDPVPLTLANFRQRTSAFPPTFVIPDGLRTVRNLLNVDRSSFNLQIIVDFSIERYDIKLRLAQGYNACLRLDEQSIIRCDMALRMADAPVIACENVDMLVEEVDANNHHRDYISQHANATVYFTDPLGTAIPIAQAQQRQNSFGQDFYTLSRIASIPAGQ